MSILDDVISTYYQRTGNNGSADTAIAELAQLRDELEERRKNYIVMCDRLVAEENKNKDLAAKTKAVKAAAVLCEHDFSAQYIGKVCVHCGRAELLPPCD